MGKKSAGQVIGGIFGLAAAVFLPGFGSLYGLQLLGATFGAITLGTSIGGIFDPPKVAKPDFGSIGSAIGSPRYGFDKLSSTVSADLPVGVLYGQLKLAGNIIYQSDEEQVSTVPDPGPPPPVTSGGFLGGLVITTLNYAAWEAQQQAFQSSGGTRSQIQRCIGVCEGEIAGIYDVRINDKPITDYPNCNYSVYTGTSTQTIDSRFTGLIDGLRYIAHLDLTLSTSDKLNGNPNVTFQAVGKLIKTWNGSEWSTTKDWSDNPAACIRDILTSKQYGVGLPEAALDNDSFGEVYEWCNGYVTSFNGSQEKRATLNYIIDSRRNILDVLNDMLATFGGFLILNGSKIKIRSERDEAVTQAFNMSNIVRGSFSYIYMNRNERPNRVKVQYIDPNYNYTKVFAISDDPNDQDERRAMGVGEDIIEKEMALLGITSANQASRIAEFVLNLGKVSSIVTTFDVGIRALAAEVGDVVTVSHDVSGWSAKEFRVLSVQEKSDETMTLVCREYNGSIYSDNPGQNIIFTNTGTSTDSFNTPNPPRNFSVFQNGATVSFTWSQPIPKFDVDIDHFEIREGDSWSGGLVVADNITSLYLNLTTFTTGLKKYHIKAVSTRGIESDEASDIIEIGIPAGFNAIIEYDEWIDTQWQLSRNYSSGIEVIRTTDQDSDQWLRAYGVKTEDTWDEGNWDGTGLWDTPVVTDTQTIEIGSNYEIDLLDDTTASIALGVNYYLGNTTGDDSYTRSVDISTRASTDTSWGDYEPFITGYSINQKRYVKFKVSIGSLDSEDDIRLFFLNARVDVPDKIERNNNVIVPSTGLVVVYNIDFLTKVAVTVTTSGGSNLIPNTSNKSLDGFTITLYNTSGVATSGICDWIASGY